MSLEPLSNIAVDSAIFGLRKWTPLTIQVLALNIVTPMPLIDAVGIDEGIKQ